MGNRLYRDKEWLKKRHCEEKKSAYEIAEICGADNVTIYTWLKKFGLRREPTFRRRSRSKYLLNEEYFKDIDSSNKAYWLGFIAADGCVENRIGKRVLYIQLNRKDRDHLEKLKEALEYEGPIYDGERIKRNKRYLYSSLQICSCKMIQDLVKYGIVPNKSDILKRPNIDKEYYNHWIRGLFDGDGSVSLCKDGNIRGEFFGTRDIMGFVVENMPGTDTVSKKMGSKGWYHGFGGNRLSRKIYEYMYKNADIFLERKKEIFLLTSS